MGEKLYEDLQEKANNIYDTRKYEYIRAKIVRQNPRRMGKKSAKQYQSVTWWLYKPALHTARPHTFGGFRETHPPTPLIKW